MMHLCRICFTVTIIGFTTLKEENRSVAIMQMVFYLSTGTFISEKGGFTMPSGRVCNEIEKCSSLTTDISPARLDIPPTPQQSTQKYNTKHKQEPQLRIVSESDSNISNEATSYPSNSSSKCAIFDFSRCGVLQTLLG